MQLLELLSPSDSTFGAGHRGRVLDQEVHLVCRWSIGITSVRVPAGSEYP